MQPLITCEQCGKEHEIGRIEPSLRRPDAILAIPLDERAATTTEGKDYYILWRRPHAWWMRPFLTMRKGFGRYFLRVMMPFAVAGREAPINWGIWVEVGQAEYRLAQRLWDSPEQSRTPPFKGVLANNIEAYPPSLGLPGSVQLESPSRVPTFRLADGTHPIIAEQLHGVTEQIVLNWLRPIVHPETTAV